ncbi:hypothetical protein JOD31_000068 [Methylopila capsulata]|uniref:Uncharacterized protein n=2 Tax=Methylopila capsulata TaxID=61654 RepID=A0A9W6IU56_9HYPH|nr:hypothetical protein [Methylopila capsulata]MBM7849856.1 hypothetical protein [Methylopila capsulata]GLK55146.1 hypothetical protein GCM10008170_11650 [Methylopila capsulata]
MIIYGSAVAVALFSMSALDLLEARLAESQPITVDDLGGVDEILADADRLQAAPFLDILADMVSAAPPTEGARLHDFLVGGFAVARDPQSFRDAIDRLIRSTTLRAAIAQAVVAIFTRRIRERATERETLIAAYALEGLFRLALEGDVSRHRPLLELTEVASDVPGSFAQHVAKIGGAAFHAWGDDDLLTMLHRLLDNEEAESEAAFELGLAHLARALDGKDMATILAGLGTARLLFERAREVDDDRSDARAYRSAIDLVLGFAANRSVAEMQATLTDLVTAARDRAVVLRTGHVVPWLAPRQDVDIEWFELARTVQRAADDLARPSWINAATTMDRILAVYDASCTIAHGDGLRLVLRPRVEASFLRERGLAGHLDDLLSEGQWPDAQRTIAQNLRAGLDEAHRAGAGPGKARENEQYPLLARILPEGASTEQIPSDMARSLEVGLASHVAHGRVLANPVLQRVLASLRDQLAASSEYTGEIQQAFDAVLQQILMFCSDRQNAEIRDLGARGAYLRASDPSEADLQADLRDFLKGNLVGAEVLSEVRGVATGRTDLYISLGGPAFVIELKKHEGAFSPEAANRYLAQATSYQAANVRLGFLGALELVDRPGPVPSIEECLWHSAYVPEGGALARHLIVFRVPGRLRSPSALR